MLVSKLKPIVARSDELDALLSSKEVVEDVARLTSLSKEKSEIQELASCAREYIGVLSQIDENRSLLGDAELHDLARDELKQLEIAKAELECKVKLLLIPKDPNDKKNIFLEIRAGTGGDEAGIFVGDLFDVYVRYAESKRWKVELISSSENSVGGYKEVIALIKGEGAYSKLKFEGGTHRVQRVPKTEAQGRIHTSAITVAIMPEADDVDVVLNPADLKIDVFRSGGHGGQSVNTTDSAVRITHIPTGITVSMQDEKSQHKNKDKAMKILKARLNDLQIKEQNEKSSVFRKTQVGSGDRSERIRTYNYPQNRLSDHRVSLTIYGLDEIMINGDLDRIIDHLIANHQSEVLGRDLS